MTTSAEGGDLTFRKRARRVRLAVIAFTVLTAWLSATKLRLSSDLSDLFPDHGAAAMLTRYLHAFGGGDLGVVLLQGDDPGEVAKGAELLEKKLAAATSVTRVLTEAPLPRDVDPTLAWNYAGVVARERLRAALTDDGMRARLGESKRLLLAPGSSDAETWLARDPLRLTQIPWEARTELAAGLTASSDGFFVGDGGRARLVVCEPKGSAFDGHAANAFGDDAAKAIAETLGAFPGLRAGLTGGHAIAVATEALIVRDMILSGTLSTILASLVFLLTFRRFRALVAVLPPLVLGTMWAMGLAALFPKGLSAIASAFGAVVIGVGVDTGVHVYAALLDARRAGKTPREAAREARRQTLKPTLYAAGAAGCAFASLALSELSALRQLGLLCGAGEILTAIAILIVTPEIGALLERKDPPPRPASSIAKLVFAVTRTKPRAAAVLAVVALPLFVLSVIGWPRPADALVAIRPRALQPLVVQREIYKLFGGREGQWLVVVPDKDREHARDRADHIAEALEPLAARGTIGGFDALISFAPSPTTQRARQRERDALDLPAKAPRLRAALTGEGFDPEACAPGIEALAHPTSTIIEAKPEGPIAWLLSRHLAEDKDGWLGVLYVRPAGDPERDRVALAAIAEADPGAVVTGYHHLETELARSLAHDLPIVAIVAVVLVLLTLRAVLKRPLDVGLALGTILIEIGGVCLVMRAAHIPWHVYDALVLPVLVGITMDESMFLLYAARAKPLGEAWSIDQAIRRGLEEQGALVASTALTTAAGFGALLFCRFEGLFDLGAVGTLGSVLGLVSSLIVVPAGLRLFAKRPES